MVTNIKKRDIIWNYIGTVLSLGINFIMLPMLMYFLDAKMIGIWQIFTSLGAVALLLDFGLTPTLARSVAYIWGGAQSLTPTGVMQSNTLTVNYDLLLSVIKACKYIYMLIALIAILGLSTVGSYYIYYIGHAVGGAYSYITSWGIYVIAIFLNLYYYYYSSLLIGVGGVAENSKARVYASLAQVMLCMLMLFLNAGILAPSIAYLAYGTLYRLLAKKYFHQYCDIGINLKHATSKIDISHVRHLFLIIWHNAWRDGLVSLSNYLVLQANTIICSLFFSLEQTGLYSLSLQLVTAIGLLASLPYFTYQPQIQSAYVSRRVDMIKNIMSIAVVSYYVLFLLGMSVLIFIGLPILSFISPSYKFNVPILIAIAVYIFFHRRCALYTSYISNTNEIPYMKAFLISSFFSVLFSYIFCDFTDWNIWGIVAGQSVAQAVYNYWFWPQKVKRELQLNEIKMLTTTMAVLQTYIKHVIKTW